MDSVFATVYTQQTGARWNNFLERWRTLLLLVHSGLGAPDPARPPGGNETDLLTGGPTAADSGGLADMLVVTTTVGMLNRVHGHTTHLIGKKN
jgi:hypothetical protein